MILKYRLEIFLDRKESFLAFRKFPFFPKGLTHDYGEKTEFFSVLFFAQK